MAFSQGKFIYIVDWCRNDYFIIIENAVIKTKCYKKNEITEWARDYIDIHLKKFALPLNIYLCLYSIVEKTAVCTSAALDALQ